MRALWSDSALVRGSQSTGLGKMVQEPRARFHVAKWGVFCHSAWLQISPARFKFVYSDNAISGEVLKYLKGERVVIYQNRDRPQTVKFV